VTEFSPAGIVDAWINPNLGPPTEDAKTVGYLFPELARRWERGTTVSQLIDEMDAAGVAKGVLVSGYGTTDTLAFTRAALAGHPDRFVGSHHVDIRQGLPAVRFAESLVRDEGFRMIRALGLESQLPYNHPHYYPLYAKCAELGVPVCLNVGIPGPLVSGRHQHPLAIDDVCAFMPELTVVMAHGGEPWVDLCVKLLVKWPNLYMMTSAFAPRHIPEQYIKLINTRGADKLMFASDYPLLTHERCAAELVKLPFRDETRYRKFVSGNAEKMFFS
jgi:predicted TIM-barrel fold metal-dependent hydrolase